MNPSDYRFIPKAIRRLRPGARFSISGTDIKWLDDQQAQPSWSEIEQTIPAVKAAEAEKNRLLKRQLSLAAEGVTDRTKIEALFATVAYGDTAQLDELKDKINNFNLKQGGA